MEGKNREREGGRLMAKDKAREGRRRCEALEEAKQTAAWSSQEEAAARGEMLHAGDVSRSDTWVAERTGPTQWRGGREHWEALWFTVGLEPLQARRVSAAKSSEGMHPFSWIANPPLPPDSCHCSRQMLGCIGATAEGHLLKAVGMERVQEDASVLL